MALRVAKGGNVPAIAVVERMWRQRDRSVVIDLPPITDAVSLAEAHARVIARAAGGKITPRQGVAFATMLEWFDRVGYDVHIRSRSREFGIRPTSLADWAAKASWR